MTTNEAKEILEGIKGYENTMDLIENHSVSVQDACAIGINAIEEVERYKQAIEDIKAEISKERAACGNFSDGIATAYGLKRALGIINKRLERMKPRLIDANALMDYCLNQKTKTIDCNDIARFPSASAVLERPEGEWEEVRG